MTVGILQKAVDELNKDKPLQRLDYIRGLLETLIEMQPKASIIPQAQPQPIQSNIRAPIKITPQSTLKDAPDAVQKS